VVRFLERERERARVMNVIFMVFCSRRLKPVAEAVRNLLKQVA
jgi:hypothetical protein